MKARRLVMLMAILGVLAVAIDSQTHRVYVPLANIDGRPVLRVYEPLQTGP